MIFHSTCRRQFIASPPLSKQSSPSKKDWAQRHQRHQRNAKHLRSSRSRRRRRRLRGYFSCFVCFVCFVLCCYARTHARTHAACGCKEPKLCVLCVLLHVQLTPFFRLLLRKFPKFLKFLKFLKPRSGKLSTLKLFRQNAHQHGCRQRTTRT